MNFKEIIESITKPFVEDENKNLLYFSFPDEIINSVCSILPSQFKVIDLAEDYSPVKPFLGILREFNPTEDDIRALSYSLHIETLISFFKTGKTFFRTDPIRPEEVFFEKLCFRNTIMELLRRYVSGTYIILNAQLLPDTAISIIKGIRNQDFKAKFIFCFNTTKIDSSDSSIDDFYQKISTGDNFFEFSEADEEMVSQVETEKKSSKNVDFEEMAVSLQNCSNLLALNQGLSLINRFEELQIQYKVDRLVLRKIYIEAATICFYAGKTDNAINYLTSVLEDNIIDEIELRALYILSLIKSERGENNSVKIYLNTIKKRLEYNTSNPYYALACAQEYSISQLSKNENSVEHYLKALEILSDRNLENAYLHTLLVVPWATLNDYEHPHDAMPMVEKAIEASEKIGNQFALSTAYHWKAILLLHKGMRKEATEWYLRCVDIRTQIGELSSIMKVRNGLSYEYLTSSKFKESYDLLNSFISRLPEISDNSEIVITLSNVANVLFYSRNFSTAYEYFQKILYYINVFDFRHECLNAFIPNYNDILTFKSYIDLVNGYTNRAKIAFHYISISKPSKNPVSVTILKLFNAALEIEEGHLENAIKIMDECEALFAKFSETEIYRRVFILYEFACALQNHNYFNEAQAYFNKGLELAKKYELSFFLRENSNTLLNYFSSIPVFEKPSLNLSAIDIKVEKERLITQMRKRLQDSQFLNRIMSTSAENLSVSAYSSIVSSELMNYLLPETITIAEKKNDKWKILHSIINTDEPELTQEQIDFVSDKTKRKHAGNYLTYISEMNVYCANISKFDFEGIIVMSFNEKPVITTETRNILHIAITNIQSQFVMRRQNENLVFISSTDQLSLVKNRHALQEKIESESQKIRQELEKKGTERQISVCFMDLDNFKHVNDSLGHEAGDLVIRRFADVLKKVYGHNNFISRFGGDEFIVLMADTTPETAAKKASELQNAMKAAEYFIPELEELCGSTDMQVDGKHVGFSMGICSNLDQEDTSDMESAVTNADRALYYSKEHGKNTTTLWKDIKNTYNA